MIMSSAITMRSLLSLLLLTTKIAAVLSATASQDERDNNFRNSENDFTTDSFPRTTHTNLRIADPSVATSDSELPLGSFPNIGVEKGVTFTRTITQFPDDAAFSMNLDDHNDNDQQHVCQQRDEYGDNECHFDWGQLVTGNFTVKFSDQIEQGDFIVGDVKVDRIIPYQFRCALCGDDCVLSIPVINVNFTIPMPKECPIPVHTSTKHMVQQLWDHSPTSGVFPTRVDGSVQMIQGKTGRTLVEFSVEAFIK